MRRPAVVAGRQDVGVVHAERPTEGVGGRCGEGDRTSQVRWWGGVGACRKSWPCLTAPLLVTGGHRGCLLRRQGRWLWQRHVTRPRRFRRRQHSALLLLLGRPEGWPSSAPGVEDGAVVGVGVRAGERAVRRSSGSHDDELRTSLGQQGGGCRSAHRAEVEEARQGPTQCSMIRPTGWKMWISRRRETPGAAATGGQERHGLGTRGRVHTAMHSKRDVVPTRWLLQGTSTSTSRASQVPVPGGAQPPTGVDPNCRPNTQPNHYAAPEPPPVAAVLG